MSRRLLPIEGMPADRPVCAWCDRKLKPISIDQRAQRSGDVGDFRSGNVIARQFERWDSYGGLFDRLQCALAFAIASHRGGFRRRRVL